MEPNEINFTEDRIYKTGKLNHDYFYKKGSINDKFKIFLDTKYDGKVECYIKPYGSFSKDGDNITEFSFQFLDHNNSYRKYINQVHINFHKNSDDSYILGCNMDGNLRYKGLGYNKKLSEQLFKDTIEFLDSIYEIL